MFGASTLLTTRIVGRHDLAKFVRKFKIQRRGAILAIDDEEQKRLSFRWQFLRLPVSPGKIGIGICADSASVDDFERRSASAGKSP